MIHEEDVSYLLTGINVLPQRIGSLSENDSVAFEHRVLMLDNHVGVLSCLEEASLSQHERCPEPGKFTYRLRSNSTPTAAIFARCNDQGELPHR